MKLRPATVSLLLLLLACLWLVEARSDPPRWRPVVLMHGIDDTSQGLQHVVDLLKTAFPGIYVNNVEIGTKHDSLWTNMDTQIERFCANVSSDPILRAAGSFNLIGFSQGAVTAKGFIARCFEPRVHSFISWVGPQAGQFGIPVWDNKLIDRIIAEIPYDKLVQQKLSFSNYWKDPRHNDVYLSKCLTLPDINNERPEKNADYRKHFLALENLMLVYSQVDVILRPKETGWWGFYNITQAQNQATNTTDFDPNTSGPLQIVPLQETAQFREDWLGLRSLSESKRLHFATSMCPHQDYSSSCFDTFFPQIAFPLLNNTLPSWPV